MKKADIAGRMVDRTGLSRAAAGNAVDAVFEAVGEALARKERCEGRWLRDVHD